MVLTSCMPIDTFPSFVQDCFADLEHPEGRARSSARFEFKSESSSNCEGLLYRLGVFSLESPTVVLATTIDPHKCVLLQVKLSVPALFQSINGKHQLPTP